MCRDQIKWSKITFDSKKQKTFSTQLITKQKRKTKSKSKIIIKVGKFLL